MVNLVVMLTIVAAGVFIFLYIIYLLNKDLTMILLFSGLIKQFQIVGVFKLKLKDGAALVEEGGFQF